MTRIAASRLLAGRANAPTRVAAAIIAGAPPQLSFAATVAPSVPVSVSCGSAIAPETPKAGNPGPTVWSDGRVALGDVVSPDGEEAGPAEAAAGPLDLEGGQGGGLPGPAVEVADEPTPAPRLLPAALRRVS